MKLKRYFAGLFAGLLLLSHTLSTQAETYQVRALHMYAHSYAVMDANTGEILFGENVDKQIYPASTAKLMAAIVAVESGVSLDTTIETQSKIVNNTTPGTYNLGLKGGESYSLSSLLHMSLIASAADATDTMAVSLYGNREAFAAKMMEKVEELGLTATSFDNPVGSDIGGGFYETYSTAREMCEIARYAMANSTIRKIVKKATYTITGNGNVSGRTIRNTNYFYNQYNYNRDAFTIIGTKTGQTTAAGNVFIATAVDKEGHELICAYFGKDTKEQTFRWIDNLLTYAFKHYKEGNLTLSKGAYNIRYHEAGQTFVQSMTADIFKQNSKGVLDLTQTITESQALSMLEACWSQEASKRNLSFYPDSLSPADTACSKEFFTNAVQTVLPGIEDLSTVSHYLSQLSETVTLEEAALVIEAGTDSLDLYEMTFPDLSMQTWSLENPIPFANTLKLPTGFLTSFGRD